MSTWRRGHQIHSCQESGLVMWKLRNDDTERGLKICVLTKKTRMDKSLKDEQLRDEIKLPSIGTMPQHLGVCERESVFLNTCTHMSSFPLRLSTAENSSSAQSRVTWLLCSQLVEKMIPCFTPKIHLWVPGSCFCLWKLLGIIPVILHPKVLFPGRMITNAHCFSSSLNPPLPL